MTTNLALVSLWNTPVLIDAADVLAVNPLPSPGRYLGMLGSQVQIGVNSFAYVQGPPDIVLAQVAAALATAEQDSSVQYAPTLVADGGGSAVAVGDFRAVKVGTRVDIIGKLNFTPNTPGVLETITISLPVSMQPANFVNASDASGVAFAENQGNTNVQATVGAKTVELDETSAGAVGIAVAFSYTVP